MRTSEEDLLINGINMYGHMKKDSYTLQELYEMYYDFELTGSRAPEDKENIDLRFADTVSADQEEPSSSASSAQSSLPDSVLPTPPSADSVQEAPPAALDPKQARALGVIGAGLFGAFLLFLLLLFKRRKKDEEK